MAGLTRRHRRWRVRPSWLIAIGPASPLYASVGRLGTGTSPDIAWGKIVAALALCIMLAILAALALKRGGGRMDIAGLRAFATRQGSFRRIDVIETRRATQHADICLLRCDDREYLVLSSAAQQLVLREQAIAAGAPAHGDALAAGEPS